MNEQDISEFRKIERRFYRQMKKRAYQSIPDSHSFVGCCTFLTKESERSVKQSISSIFDVPFKDYWICVQINRLVLAHNKNSKIFKQFVKMAQRYFRQRCNKECYEYNFVMLVCDQPYFSFKKMNPSAKILNQLE